MHSKDSRDMKHVKVTNTSQEHMWNSVVSITIADAPTLFGTWSSVSAMITQFETYICTGLSGTWKTKAK